MAMFRRNGVQQELHLMKLPLDLGEVNTVSAVDIFHAEAGGESADMNTKSYTILVSQDGNSFEEVYSVTKNTNGTTHNAFTPKDARYVKLVVNKPTQGKRQCCAYL